MLAGTVPDGMADSGWLRTSTPYCVGLGVSKPEASGLRVSAIIGSTSDPSKTLKISLPAEPSAESVDDIDGVMYS